MIIARVLFGIICCLAILFFDVARGETEGLLKKHVLESMGVHPGAAASGEIEELNKQFNQFTRRLSLAQQSGIDISPVLDRFKTGFETFKKTKDKSIVLKTLKDAERTLTKIFPPEAEEKLKADLMLKSKQSSYYLLGQCHIDLAWRWMWPETIDITRNTFWRQIRAMKADPTYTFYQNQAALYDAVKQHDPALFQAIKEQVKTGQWRIMGGQWAETSQEQCSGESIVRNYLYGQQFFQKHFGMHASVGWQMEGSGYLSSFPQVMKNVGLKGAILGRQAQWHFPWHPALFWKGNDGTSIPLVCISHYYTFQERGLQDEIGLTLLAARSSPVKEYLFAFGGGDHGGGVNPGLRRKLRQQFESAGLPSPLFETDPSAYFDRVFVSQETNNIPTYSGHIHLAPYGGTKCGLINQHRIKKGVRESENLLFMAELWSTLSPIITSSTQKIDFEDAWKKLLVNQFHDIIWGSTVFEAYEEALGRFQKLQKIGKAALHQTLHETLIPKIKTQGEGTPIIVFNSLPWNRTEPVIVDLPSYHQFFVNRGNYYIQGSDGKRSPVQQLDKKLLFVAADVPAAGYQVFWLRQGQVQATDLVLNNDEKEILLRNSLVRVSINKKNGSLGDLVFLPGNHKLIAARANQLVVRRDLGNAWGSNLGQQLWENNAKTAVSILERGPVVIRVQVETEWPGRNRTIQWVDLYNGSPQINFTIRGTWQEKKTQLLVRFPLVIGETTAYTEIPFGVLNWHQYQHEKELTNPLGSLLRYYNHGEDKGEEIPQNRWTALEGQGNVVALLNDSKSAIRIETDGFSLPILRTPQFPDRGKDVNNPSPGPGEPGFGAPDHNDLGEFDTRYALLAGKGTWKSALVHRRAQEFNLPLIGVATSSQNGDLPYKKSFLRLDPSNLLLSSLKMAEDRSGDWIIRVYEATGQKTTGVVSLPEKAAFVYEADLLEENQHRLAGNTADIEVQFRPHEIKTFRVRWKQ